MGRRKSHLGQVQRLPRGEAEQPAATGPALQVPKLRVRVARRPPQPVDPVSMRVDTAAPATQPEAPGLQLVEGTCRKAQG
ncbi:hypothetical protein H920_05641 [Fukomys damarensis]|uniref:Uncharacterized protein n=1 Tax=Fukomys damarensis TaxID=885580 RepID=A0A091DRX4_FUKDA|nr:hypothetical protein H920_05641 [Fukomys damarensis]